jgi:hypothetical protein
MDFILTDIQKAVIGLSFTFIILPSVVGYTLWKVINLIPEKYLDKVL